MVESGSIGVQNVQHLKILCWVLSTGGNVRLVTLCELDKRLQKPIPLPFFYLIYCLFHILEYFQGGKWLMAGWAEKHGHNSGYVSPGNFGASSFKMARKLFSCHKNDDFHPDSHPFFFSTDLHWSQGWSKWPKKWLNSTNCWRKCHPDCMGVWLTFWTWK